MKIKIDIKDLIEICNEEDTHDCPHQATQLLLDALPDKWDIEYDENGKIQKVFSEDGEEILI